VAISRLYVHPDRGSTPLISSPLVRQRYFDIRIRGREDEALQIAVLSSRLGDTCIRAYARVVRVFVERMTKACSFAARR
jgi:hypothetical protein